jgi:lysozyme
MNNAIELAVELAKKYEGCKLDAYWDASGNIWTIGYGCTGHGIVNGTKWSQEYADAELRRRITIAHDQILTASPVLIRESDKKQAAISDFVYNLGFGTYINSKNLKRLIDLRDWQSAAAKLKEYCHAGGEILPGLVARRNEEAALLLQLT